MIHIHLLKTDKEEEIKKILVIIKMNEGIGRLNNNRILLTADMFMRIMEHVLNISQNSSEWFIFRHHYLQTYSHTQISY